VENSVVSGMKCLPVDSYTRTKQEHRNYEIDFDKKKFDYAISHIFFLVNILKIIQIFGEGNSGGL
jgi:hypothetical protein